jgi:hypothetical protein
MLLPSHSNTRAGGHRAELDGSSLVASMGAQRTEKLNSHVSEATMSHLKLQMALNLSPF